MAVVIGARLTVDEVDAVARRRAAVELPDGVLAAVGRTHEAARRVAATRPVYGRTTGVGANKSTAVTGDPAGHGARLLRSHAVDAGEPLPREHVRALLVVRAQQLAQAGSGAAPELLTALVEMLRDDRLPVVRAWGAIGTGDLSALAVVGLALAGERPTDPPTTGVPLLLDGESALPLLSSSALTLGRAALCVVQLDALSRAAEAVFALTAHAAGANPEHWSTAAAAAAAHPGVEVVAARVRGLLHPPAPGRRLQDRYGFRAFVHAHGVLESRAAQLRRQVEALVNVAQENPLFDERAGTAVHHAGFFQSALAQDVDAATLALAATVPLLLGRLAQLNDPEVTGLAPFLAGGPAGSSGLMVVEYVAAAAAAEVRACAQPASLGTAVLSRAAEEDATFAPQAVDQAFRAVAAWRVLLACELLAAARLARLTGALQALPPALRAVGELAASLDEDDDDHDLRPSLERAEAALSVLAGSEPTSSGG